jgi:F-type H+-transporting ATPase subunit delta
MKKSKKEILKIAKRLFHESFTNRKLNIAKIRMNVSLIKKSYKGRALEILRAYSNLVRRYLAQETLSIEASDALAATDIDQIRSHFEKKHGKRLIVRFQKNPSLLGGLKVALGDILWDFSVKEKISQMKEALSDGYR